MSLQPVCLIDHAATVSADRIRTAAQRGIRAKTTVLAVALLCALLLLPGVRTAQAQSPVPATEGPGTDTPPANITVVPRTQDQPAGVTGADPDTPVPVRLEALLTNDGQRIEQGLVWRIYGEAPAGGIGKLISTKRDAVPVIPLKPGTYIVNAAFGRAHLTRRITVAADPNAQAVKEQFVLNAGGLRVTTLIGAKPAPPGSITYSIHTDRDQTDDRRLILAGAKPGLVIRLNAGIYHIVSTYGDANAVVRSDVTVEAGKLTEATLVHQYARVAFKLVTRAGGEALPATQWTVQTPEGSVVKESVGALPTHILAPGRYAVVARNQGKAFRRDFEVGDGQSAEIEIVLQ